MIAARVAMIVKTTSSSTSVNPRCRVLRFVCMLIFHEAFAFLKSLVYIAMWRCISVLAACNIGRSMVSPLWTKSILAGENQTMLMTNTELLEDSDAAVQLQPLSISGIPDFGPRQQVAGSD